MRVDGGGEPVEWRFRPDGLVLGAVRGETAILWSRGADRRILQTAVGSLRIAGDAAEFLPAIVIGRGG
jgi:hypothetical protein